MVSQTGQRARQAASAPERRAKYGLHETITLRRGGSAKPPRPLAAEYRAKYHKAVESVAAHRKRLTAFFDSASPWKQLPTATVIESTFATVRLRERSHVR